ncbi:MAG: histidine phosphatase family protein [Burkholderiales bacterium]|nr:histidine phosphatase family protein [Burkholderiales bacterium]
MDLILWRHAHALDTLPDIERELSPKGIKQAQKMARWLNSKLPENCRILVSPATRTRQTADALERKYKIVTDLAPDASALQVLQAANWPQSKETVLIVGHQPTLGLVAASLLLGQEQAFEIRKSYVCWISQREQENRVQTFLKAMLGPEMANK